MSESGNNIPPQPDQSPTQEQVSERERMYALRQAEGDPFFTGEWFDVLFSTTDPHGFLIQTTQVARRREDIDNFPAGRIHHANAAHEKKQNLRGKKFGAKVAIRGIQPVTGIHSETGEKLEVLALEPIVPATYATYKEFGSPQEGEMGEKLANVAGVAMMLVTADGKIIVQKRGKNSTYGDNIDADKKRGIPGASAAGTLDAEFYSREEIAEAREKGIDLRGIIKPVDNEYINKRMLQELLEEDGIQASEVEFATVAYVKDNINPHVEFCNVGVTSLTAEQVIERANANHATRGDEGFDFAERVMVLTPEELEKLLTQVHVPIPPTHAADMLFTLQFVWQRTGMSEEEIQERMLRLRQRMQENNRTINKIIRKYYEANPKALKENRTLYPNLNEFGYDPRIYGVNQGIPPLDEELERVGIKA